MITLELTLVDHMTGRDEGRIFLVGDRFVVTSRTIRVGGTERDVTVVNDGLCRHDGYFISESYEDVRDMISNKIITARAKA
jgi:hypothetical protein|tara:strand:- start:503 stop:745 length:243 start_codon:yes stop_codon:yes gene_type:complete